MSNLAMMMGLGSGAGGGWSANFANASYDNVSFSFSGQASNPRGLFFKPDGTKMYTVCNVTDSAFQYSLSTPWDVSTASYDSKSFSTGGFETQPSNINFNDDGTLMYITGYTGDDVNKLELTTAWDISTATNRVQTSISGQTTSPYGLCFSDDGTKMYAMGIITSTYARIFQYTLSTAWDTTTLNYDGKYWQGQVSGGLFINPDGTEMYVVDFEWGDSVRYLSLSTAYDISTATEVSSFSLSAQGGSPSGIFFKPDGKKMYTSDYSTDSVFQYSTA
jgi:DNA-binding beta-propeller fold protein YncE